MTDKNPFIVAIDGASGSGKHTIAAEVAKRYNLAYLDTGMIYRAIALRAYDDLENAVKHAASVTLEDLANEEVLRHEEVAAYASIVAARQDVRQAALRLQQDFAYNPPAGKAGAVLDGRDIGTVVLPSANVKLFVVTSLEHRAGRRHDEMKARYQDHDYSLATITQSLLERDQRDSKRNQAPLVQAKDAYLINNDRKLEDTLLEVFSIIDPIWQQFK